MKKNNWKSMVGCTVATMTICMGATALAADTNLFIGNDAVNGSKNQPSVNDVAGNASNVPETVAQITKELKTCRRYYNSKSNISFYSRQNY